MKSSTKLVESFLRKKITSALESSDRDSLEWALNELVVKSLDNQFILKPRYGLLDRLLIQIRNHWEIIKSIQSLDNDEPRDFFYPHADEINFVYRCGTILRNLSFITENAKIFAQHGGLVNFIMEILRCNSERLIQDGLEMLSNLSDYFVLDEKVMEYFVWILQMIYKDNLETVSLVLVLYAKLSSRVENYKFLGPLLNIELFQRLEQLLFLGDNEMETLRDNSMLVLLHSSQNGSMRMRIQLVQNTNLLRSLIGLMENKEFELSDQAIEILVALASEPKNRDCFLPFQEYFMEMIALNHPLSHFAEDILAEL